MSRYTASIFKKSRQYGISLLENNKEFSKGKKRSYRPGQHGNSRRRKLSSYGQQSREKQKLRFLYGLTEKQFRNTFLKAKKMSGILGTNFLISLESRLDNICYRLGFSPTRAGARQMVNHGHVLVNNKKVDIPSYIVQINDTITLKDKVQKNPLLRQSLDAQVGVAEYLEFDNKTMTGKFLRYPERTELNQEINENLIVEWYNRLI